MRRRVWLAAAVLAVVVAAIVVLGQASSRKPQTVASVVKAFSAKGIELEATGFPVGSPTGSLRVHPLGVLWNRSHASEAGLVWVFVLPTVAQARLDNGAQHTLNVRDVCGKNAVNDFQWWQSVNVDVALSKCVYTDTPVHQATKPANDTVTAIMRGISG